MVIHWAVTQSHVGEPHPVSHKDKNCVCAMSTDNHKILGYEQDNWQKIDVTDRSGDVKLLSALAHLGGARRRADGPGTRPSVGCTAWKRLYGMHGA